MLLFGGCGLGRLLDAVLAIEALDASRSIDQPLLAGIKRMAVRAHFDVHLIHGRTSFEGVSACARHNATMVFGMDCSFHLTCPYSDPSHYHCKDNHTISRVNWRSLSILALCLIFMAAANAHAAPAATALTTLAPRFAPAGRTDFAPILEL